MSGVEIDSKVFYARTKRLFSKWAEADKDADLEGLRGVDGLAVIVGDAEEDLTPKKGVAVQTWLLGYEFPSTILVFRKTDSGKKIFALTSTSKAKILAQIKQSDGIDFEVVSRPKDAAGALQATEEFVEKLRAGQGKLKMGHFVKDAPKGKLVDDWKASVEKDGSEVELVDITPAMASVLAPKDERELEQHTTAARLCSTLMAEYFKPKMEAVLDKGTKMSHEYFATLCEAKLGNDTAGPDMKLWNKNKQLANVDFQSSDWVYTPIIQSGGKYDLKVSAESNQDNLKADVILASMGIKYKEYCGNIARTFMIGPHKSQESNYVFLLELQQSVLKKMKAGVQVKELYDFTVAEVQKKKPDLADKLVKSIGFGTGIDFRDSAYVINGKNAKTLQENMVFNLSLGFANIPDPKNKNKTYALQLADLVKVGKDTGILITEGTKKVHEVILDEDEESEPEEVPKSKKPDPKPKEAPAKGVVIGNKVLRRTKTRNQGKEIDQSKQETRKQHQRELHEAILKTGIARYKGSKDGNSGGEGKTWKKFESYRREDQLPGGVKNKRIFVDEAKSTIILPINGFITPFHISTIKNVSLTDEGDQTMLRINFQSPGQILGKKEDTPFENPQATFIRSATFRSSDKQHMMKVSESITNMRKAQNKREMEKKDLADVIEQEKLIEMKGRRPHRLGDVQIRPALDNKRIAPGELEIHQNGLRYYAQNGNKVDLLFSNIKHLFFQPCDGEMSVIIHVHLKAPIMLSGKKKARDVQFVREVTDAAFDETGNRKRKSRYGDEDEIEQEQEERRKRGQLNREFQAFGAKIAEAALDNPDCDFELDGPYRDLAFSGVPFRSNVLLQPTAECLVHLTDSPFLIVTLKEVEVCHLERVQFGLKNFDMVFVFSDFKRPPVHINSIPMEQLDDVKMWLDSVDIASSEGPVNLAWPAIMKTLQEDPQDFYKMGGWTFLTGDGSDEENSESSAESEFAASDDGASESEADSESDDEEFDDDASDDEDFSGDDEDDEGLDWDELENKAKRDDDRNMAEKGHDSDEERPRGKGKRR